MTNGCDMIEGPMGKKDLPPEKAAALFGVGKLKRHMFICIGPDCVDEEEGAETWKYLKKRMKELDITGADGPFYRTKCRCLRICSSGAHLRGLSGRRVVSRRDAGQCRAHHSGTPHRRSRRRRSLLRAKPPLTQLSSDR